jgi:DNA invertase Pin-like site-specific DNA recombinase
MKKAAIYARVSTRDKQSLENQLPVLQEFCRSYGFTVVAEYSDKASGGEGRESRAGFDTMLKDAYKRKFDVVVFWALDRFTREGTAKTIEYLNLLESHGVHFKSYTEQYLDSTGLFKDAIIGLLATLAKQERIRLSERVKAGLDRAKKQGRIGGRPTIPEGTRQRILELKNTGLSNRAIGRELKLTHRTVGLYLKELG